MSLTHRVHPHAGSPGFTSLASLASLATLRRLARLAPLAAAASALAIAAGGCGASMGPQKVASSGGYAPPESAMRGAGRYDDGRVVPGRGEPIADPSLAPERPGLGTSWGESVSSPIWFAPFQRASQAPWAELAFHYNDVAGAEAHAAYLGTRLAPLELYAGDGALSVALVDEDGRALPGFTAAGRTLIMGEDGARYRIVVHNASPARFEIVASVDGLDVIDGRPADPNRRGYIIDPHGVLTIDGFRTSDDAVAAFRFGRVAESYAAQTSGDRNVGVVGVAIFAERGAAWAPERSPAWTPAEIGRRDSANPFPQRGYATPPR
ncbi:MAG TPA: hypothetical protein VFK02_21980 [Kofleriaceae bacterium]|nr:hypothetical protein [Kofleriaceae bacterium]